MKKFIIFKLLVFISLAIICGVDISAQTAQKPSANYTDEKTGLKTTIRSFSKIAGIEDFKKLARVYNKGTINEIPHILFLIDRNERNRIYYINTPKYEFHLYFINELLNWNYIPANIESNYIDTNRRFILGTIAYQKHAKIYTYEFWEGDKITPALLICAHQVITQSFFDSIMFKSNSTYQEEVVQTTEIKYITQERLVKAYPYIALNTGKAIGRICIADSINNLQNINEHDILVLKEVPLSIPIVAAIITEKASTLLSHVNVLARGLKIPSIYLKNASDTLRFYEGKYIELEATDNDYQIKEIEEPKIFKLKQIQYVFKSNKTRFDLTSLSKMRTADYIYYGKKAANLGAVKANIKDIAVPDGFSIPFAHYNAFMKKHNMRDRLREIQNIPEFFDKMETRKAGLALLRNEIESAELDTIMLNMWISQWQKQLYAQGVFVRSSSNAEDLKNYSGAGLFTTIPNVKTAEDLAKAVKKVWASVYNFEAYESRRQAGISDSLIMMSVLVQLAVNSDISGVMITKDPYNPLRSDVFYIAAKKGIGIKVVEGSRIAEQVMYSESSNAIQLISHSGENTELKLSEQGGITELPVQENKRVMSDELVTKLALCGKRIKQFFGKNMDIEWVVIGKQIIILQARAYK